MTTKHSKGKRESTVAKAESPEPSVNPSVRQAVVDQISLPASCTVRDGATLKAELLPLFEQDNAVTLDVRCVERIDTAIVQLLMAFVRDRNQAHRVTHWLGEPECIGEAVRILGVGEVLNIRSARTVGAVP